MITNKLIIVDLEPPIIELKLNEEYHFFQLYPPTGVALLEADLGLLQHQRWSTL